ncbi:MAG: hypothetical protein WB791_04750 [Waddliaceae bacterium]
MVGRGERRPQPVMLADFLEEYDEKGYPERSSSTLQNFWTRRFRVV